MTEEDEALAETEKIVAYHNAILSAAKISAKTWLYAINSRQTTFEEIAESATAGLAFITRVTDSPCQVSGILGRDGVWRVSTIIVSVDPRHEMDVELEAAEAVDDKLFVLTDCAVADAMVRYAIPRMLEDLTDPKALAVFEQRLAASRFANPTRH